jgi:proteasome accessory factor A
MTAVEMHREYLGLALRYDAAALGAWVPDVLARWGTVLDALEREPRELAASIDWVAKLVMIENFMDRKSVDWRSPQVQMLDLQYHDIRPEKGLYHLLERQGKMERLASDEEIKDAISQPPEDTRAYFRGRCLRKYGDQVFGVNWDSISFGIGDEPIKRVMMAEPLKGTKAHVEELLASSRNAAELVKNLRS